MKPQNTEVRFLEEPGTHSFAELCLDLQTPSLSAWPITLDSQIADYPNDQGFHPSLPFVQTACAGHKLSAGGWGLSSTLQSFCYPKQCVTIIGTTGQICKLKTLLHILQTSKSGQPAEGGTVISDNIWALKSPVWILEFLRHPKVTWCGLYL